METRSMRTIAKMTREQAESEFGKANGNFIRCTARDIVATDGSTEIKAFYYTESERFPYDKLVAEASASISCHRKMFSADGEETFYRKVSLYELDDGWVFVFSPWENYGASKTPLGDPFANKYSFLRIKEGKIYREPLK